MIDRSSDTGMGSLRHLVCAAALAAAAPLSAQYPYASGTPGLGAITPRLASGQPWLGNTAFAFSVDRGRGGAAAALLLSTSAAETGVLGATLVVGLAPGELRNAVPLALGGAAGAPGAGGALLAAPLTFAPSPSLLGAQLFAQAVVVDPAAPAGPLAATSGLMVELTDVPMLFLGSRDLAPGPDPYALVDPRSLSTVFLGESAHTDDVRGAVFSRGGRDLFVASELGASLEYADLTTLPPRWSTLVPFAGGYPHGVAVDPRTRRLYTLVGPTQGPVDLVAFDGDPTSPSFGVELARVAGIASDTGPWQWDLSATGRRLALYTGDGGSRELLVLDADPSSSSYLSAVARVAIPDLNAPFNQLVRVRVTPGDRVVLLHIATVFVSSPGALERFDLRGGAFVDHNPSLAGVQGIGPFSQPRVPAHAIGNDLGLARDGSFATVTDYLAFDRFDFDRDDPSAWTYTHVPAAIAPATSMAHVVAADGRTLIVLTPGSPLSNAVAHQVDARTGAVLATAVVQGPSAIAQR